MCCRIRYHCCSISVGPCTCLYSRQTSAWLLFAGEAGLKQKRSGNLTPLIVPTQPPAVSKALPNGSVANNDITVSGQHSKQANPTHHPPHSIAASRAQSGPATAVATTAALAIAPAAAVVAAGGDVVPPPAEPSSAGKAPAAEPSRTEAHHAQHSMPVQAAQQAGLQHSGNAPFQPEQAAASALDSKAATASAVAEHSGASTRGLPTTDNSMHQHARGQKHDTSQVRATSCIMGRHMHSAGVKLESAAGVRRNALHIHTTHGCIALQARACSTLQTQL